MAYRSRSRSRSSYGKKRVARSRSRSSYKSVRPVSKRLGYTRIAGNYGRYSGPKAELKWQDQVFQTDHASIAATNAAQDSGAIVWLAPAVSPTSGLSLNLIAAGTGANQRVGRKVTLRHVEIKLRLNMKSQNVTIDATDKALGVRFRWVVLIDHQCNGTDLTVNSVFGQPGSTAVANGGTGVTNTFSYRQLANLKRFTILHDRVFNWQPKCIQAEYSNATPSVPSETNFFVEGGQISKSFSSALNLPIEFATSAGTPAIADVRSNNLISFVLIDSHYDQVNFRADGVARVRYSDV